MGFAAVLPIVATVLGGLSVAQTLLPGVLGGQEAAGAEAPSFDDTPFADDSSSILEDELVSQTERNRQLRRQSAGQSQSLTNLQQSPTTEDSLLRIIAGGE